MKPFGIIAVFLAFFASVIRASQSDDFINLMEEKAKIKAEAEANSKPAPGQLIFAPSSVASKQSTPTPSKVVQAAIEDIKTTANSDRKSRKSRKEEEEKSDGSDDEEKIKEPKKKSTKKDKKSSKSDSNADEEDDSNELPKRLFRPRFRAESSADPLKSFSVSTLLATLSISILAICFI